MHRDAAECIQQPFDYNSTKVDENMCIIYVQVLWKKTEMEKQDIPNKYEMQLLRGYFIYQGKEKAVQTCLQD